jgi:WD40 repeat protein
VALRRATNLRRLVRLLGGDLEWITLRALAKEPGRRYASAAELAGDVERYLRGEPVLAGPPSTLYRIRKLARRHRVAATSLVLVAVAITAGGVVSSLSLLRALRAEGAAREQLRDSLLTQALTLANGGELDGRARALAALERAAAIRPGLDARNAAIAALAVPGFRVHRRLHPSSDSIRTPQGVLRPSAWPDTRLRRYARGNADGSVSLHSIDDDAEILRLPRVSPGFPEFGVFSPDGSWLAVRYQSEELHLWNLSSHTNRLLLRNSRKYQFTPDGRHLIATTDGQLHLFDLTSGGEIRRQQAGPGSAWPAVHPTEPRFLAPVYGQGRLDVRRTSDGEVERSLDMPPLGFRALWSADGGSLITTHADYSIRVWDWPAAGAPRLILRFHRAEPTYLATDPSGRWLATGGWGNQVTFSDLRDGRLLLNQPGGAVFAAVDRADFVLISGAEWRLVELEPPYALETVAMHESDKSPRRLAFSTDGRWLATAGPDGVRVLDLRSREVHRIVGGECVVCVAFDGASNVLRAISSDHLLAWRLEDDPVTGRLRVTPTLRAARPEPPGTADPPSEDRLAAGISAGGERWMAVSTDPRGGSPSWILGRFDAAGVERTTGFQRVAAFMPGGKGPEMSPDGLWAAWGNWHGRNAAVVRLGAGAPPVELPIAGSAAVGFTPDSRRLAVGGSAEIRFHEVGTWRLLHSIPRRPPSGQPAPIAFTRDSRLGAVPLTDVVILLDPDTGEEIGVLPAPQHALAWSAFSPDDRFLAVASVDHHVLLWDLEKLRRRLREIGLDWEPGSESDS